MGTGVVGVQFDSLAVSSLGAHQIPLETKNCAKVAMGIDTARGNFQAFAKFFFCSVQVPLLKERVAVFYVGFGVLLALFRRLSLRGFSVFR